jgi:hypothetical protein
MTLLRRLATRTILALAVFAFLAAPATAGLTGSVGITMEATGSVRSAAVAEYWNDFGTAIDFSVQINYTHVIPRLQIRYG